jgi:hypothetical protein
MLGIGRREFFTILGGFTTWPLSEKSGRAGGAAGGGGRLVTMTRRDAPRAEHSCLSV